MDHSLREESEQMCSISLKPFSSTRYPCLLSVCVCVVVVVREELPSKLFSDQLLDILLYIQTEDYQITEMLEKCMGNLEILTFQIIFKLCFYSSPHDVMS